MKKISGVRLVQIGEVCVDTGTVWIGDPGYIMHTEGREFGDIGEDWTEFHMKYPDLPVSVPYKRGHEGFGVMSRTRYGDGGYPVYQLVEEPGARPLGLYVDFLDQAHEIQEGLRERDKRQAEEDEY